MTFSETFLVFLVILVVFLGVKFGFRKSCLCKRNDKYKVCYSVWIFYFNYLFITNSVFCKDIYGGSEINYTIWCSADP